MIVLRGLIMIMSILAAVLTLFTDQGSALTPLGAHPCCAVCCSFAQCCAQAACDGARGGERDRGISEGASRTVGFVASIQNLSDSQ